ASEGDGSPAIAHGDTFVFVRDASGAPVKMPFATLVTKDYPGFDEFSQLDRSGLYRLNLDVGRTAFAGLFGFEPQDLGTHRAGLDFAAVGRWCPHPVYGSYGWVSMVGPHAHPELDRLITTSLARARRKTVVRTSQGGEADPANENAKDTP
ncbi:MAG TPA: DUF6194 family protein, partial [Myxococcota bacterium]|nr:DUF6194 family protein [Myxococcota bacterium]